MTYTTRTWINEDYEASDANNWESRIASGFSDVDDDLDAITDTGGLIPALDTRIDDLEVTDTAIVPNTGVADTYTFVLTDAGKIVESQVNANTKVWTVPPNSTAFPYGATGHTVIRVFNRGTVVITLTPGSGVTFKGPHGTGSCTVAEGCTAELRKRDTNAWAIAGNIG